MENRKIIKRILTLFLAIMMLITSVPSSIIAAEGEGQGTAKNSTTQDGSTPGTAIDATGTDSNAKQIYRGKAWIERKPNFDRLDSPDDELIKGLTVYLQWMNPRQYIRLRQKMMEHIFSIYLSQ